MNGVARKAEAVTDPRQARIENVAEVPAGVEVGDCEGVLGWARSPDLIPPALTVQEAAAKQQRGRIFPDQWGQ